MLIYIKLFLLIFSFQTARTTYSTNLDQLKDNIKDTLITKNSTRKSINFDLPYFESSKLVCLQFKYLSTDNDENALLKLYLINKKTNELNEKLWSAKLSFDRQKIYEELNLNTEILSENRGDHQLQFRLLISQDESNDQLSIEQILDVNSFKLNNDYCQTRYKCIKNDCLWSIFKNETQERSIIKLKNAINTNLVNKNLIEKLNLNLKDSNVYFLVHNKNKDVLNETIYSPVLKLPINLDEIEVSFDCKSLNANCLPNDNISLNLHYKFADEYLNLINLPKRLDQFKKRSSNEGIDKFIFKLKAKDFIAKQVDIVFWISIKLKRANSTLVLSNIEVKNFLTNDLDWQRCNFARKDYLGKSTLPCGLEQFTSYDTNNVLNWLIVNEGSSSSISNYIKIINNQTSTAFYSPNELYLPRTLLYGENKDCVFKFKFNVQNANLYLFYVDDHKRQVKIWEKNEDALMITKKDSKNNWTDVAIYLGNIYQGFRLSFSGEQLVENSSIAIADLEFENCHSNQLVKLNKNKKPAELDIIRITYEEPKPAKTNEHSIYKCNFEHTSLEQCGLFSDEEILEETCPDEVCTSSEFLKSLDNFNGMTDLQLPFRDRSKNFGINGHYIYFQNMNNNGKSVKAILRFKRILSNKLNNKLQPLNHNSIDKMNTTACRLFFYLRTNGYNQWIQLVKYHIFVELISSNKLISIKTNPKFSKLNFYELNEVSFGQINEPFQILLQGEIRHNYLNQAFIYMAIDDISFTEGCLFL